MSKKLISFSSALASELQGIAQAKKEAQQGLFALGRLDRRLRRFNMHSIDSQEFMSRLSLPSRLNAESDFIEELRKEGGSRAGAWAAQELQAYRRAFVVRPGRAPLLRGEG
jgi:NTE family protein